MPLTVYYMIICCTGRACDVWRNKHSDTYWDLMVVQFSPTVQRHAVGLIEDSVCDLFRCLV